MRGFFGEFYIWMDFLTFRIAVQFSKNRSVYVINSERNKRKTKLYSINIWSLTPQAWVPGLSTQF